MKITGRPLIRKAIQLPIDTLTTHHPKPFIISKFSSGTLGILQSLDQNSLLILNLYLSNFLSQSNFLAN